MKSFRTKTGGIGKDKNENGRKEEEKLGRKDAKGCANIFFQIIIVINEIRLNR